MFVDKFTFLELSTTSVVTPVVPSSRNLCGSSDESSGVESRLHPDVRLCFHWAHWWCTNAELFVLVSDAIKEYRGLLDMLAETKTLMVALAYAWKWKRSVVAVRKGRLISSQGHSSGKERRHSCSFSTWKLQDVQPCVSLTVSWPSSFTLSCWFLNRRSAERRPTGAVLVPGAATSRRVQNRAKKNLTSIFKTHKYKAWCKKTGFGSNFNKGSCPTG